VPSQSKEKGCDWDKQQCYVAKPYLEKDGFKVKIYSEIGAMYSNTDFDTDDFIEISW
jgi:hypothetical protein